MKPGEKGETRLLIVQPYIPSYRVALFSRMRTELAVHGITLAIAAGSPKGADLQRGDDQTWQQADFRLAERCFGIASRNILSRNLRPVLEDYRPDLIIVEQAIKNLETWRLTFGVSRHVGRLGMWGHGRSFSTPQGPLGGTLKRWLTRQMDWFFAYTQQGALAVANQGFPLSRITTLRNSTDTRQLRGDLSTLTPDILREFRNEHQLVAGKTALFIGGIDERKGIDFLLDTADLIRQQLPDFKLVIAGAGQSVVMVRERQQDGAPIVYLGRVDGHQKALALAAADVVMIPEWVGLVAVDALAAGRPVMTTKHPSHSPEFGYLQQGKTALIVEHDRAGYARSVIDIFNDAGRLRAMQFSAYEAGSNLSIEEMSERFIEGILEWRNRESI